EVVITRVAGILAPPVTVVAAVDAHVADARGALRGWFDGPAEGRLVDVDEADAAFAEPGVEFGVVPALVPDLDHERILAERGDEIVEPRAALVLVLERPRELDQHGVQLAGAVERVEAVPHGAHLAEGPGLVALMREAAPEFGGEPEVLQVPYARGPLLRDFAPGRPVEGGGDLDQVEVGREVADRIEAPPLARGIDDPLPILVVPAGNADPD